MGPPPTGSSGLPGPFPPPPQLPWQRHPPPEEGSLEGAPAREGGRPGGGAGGTRGAVGERAAEVSTIVLVLELGYRARPRDGSSAEGSRVWVSLTEIRSPRPDTETESAVAKYGDASGGDH